MIGLSIQTLVRFCLWNYYGLIFSLCFRLWVWILTGLLSPDSLITRLSIKDHILRQSSPFNLGITSSVVTIPLSDLGLNTLGIVTVHTLEERQKWLYKAGSLSIGYHYSQNKQFTKSEMEPEILLKLWVVFCYTTTIIFLHIIWTLYILTLCAIVIFYIHCQNLEIHFHM